MYYALSLSFIRVCRWMHTSGGSGAGGRESMSTNESRGRFLLKGCCEDDLATGLCDCKDTPDLQNWKKEYKQ